ncbi:hypothetical protein C2S51_008449 [Perilla frutescens var. frutescens]|nr:hypothetical protein C2S51_008449 [Perilla frutescens var. frutescens]
MPTSLPYPIKVEIVVVDDDFSANKDAWSSDEFAKSIMRQRNGKSSLLAGDLTITIRDGVCFVGDVEFADNSSWIRSKKFRMEICSQLYSYTLSSKSFANDDLLKPNSFIFASPFLSLENTVFCPEIEKQSLLSFKKSLKDPYKQLSSWDGEVNCCNWNGVTCKNLTGRVHKLRVQGNHFDQFPFSTPLFLLKLEM